MTIAVIDYGMGNLHSVAKALEHVTHENVVAAIAQHALRRRRSYVSAYCHGQP